MAVIDASCFKQSVFFGDISQGKMTSDKFSLQLNMYDSAALKNITFYGV